MFRTALVVCALLTLTVIADDKKAAPPDEKAAMERMMKYGTPGPEHQKLAAMAGDFTYTAKFWMTPDAPPMEMKGTTKRTMIMDGRFLKDETSSEAQANMPAFHGQGITGFDLYKKKFVGSWIDSMSTSIANMTGELDASGKVLTMLSEQYDPMLDAVVKMRWVSKLTGPDTQSMEFYTTLPGGKEMKSGEIHYTRKK